MKLSEQMYNGSEIVSLNSPGRRTLQLERRASFAGPDSYRDA